MTRKQFMDRKTWECHYYKIKQAPTLKLKLQAEKEYNEEMNRLLILETPDTRSRYERLLDWHHERMELDPTMELKKAASKKFLEEETSLIEAGHQSPGAILKKRLAK